MIEWSDLPMTVERRRPAKASATNVDRRGEVDPCLTKNTVADGAGAEPQRIRMLIQPGIGSLDYLPEGAGQNATHRGYCNLKTQPRKPGKDAEDTDVQADDELRVIGKDGKPGALTYWVTFVGDSGGQGDHFKLLLRTTNP